MNRFQTFSFSMMLGILMSLMLLGLTGCESEAQQAADDICNAPGGNYRSHEMNIACGDWRASVRFYAGAEDLLDANRKTLALQNIEMHARMVRSTQFRELDERFASVRFGHADQP